MNTTEAFRSLAHRFNETRLRNTGWRRQAGLNESSSLGVRGRSAFYIRAAAMLAVICLVGCCLLVTMAPVVMAADDREWTVMDLNVPEGHPGFGIRGVWGSSSSNVWAVGSYGAYFRYDGSTWTYSPDDPDPSPGSVSGYLTDVHGTGESNVFVVGGKYGGTLNWYNGSVWQEVCPELHYSGDPGYYNGYLTAVWAVSESDVFAVGTNNKVIVHYDGDQCIHTNTGMDDLDLRLADIWGSSASNVFAVGDGGTILRYDGSTWTTMASGTSENLYAIWGTSAANVFAVGDSGTIVHYNGSTWTKMDAGTIARLQDIWGCSSQDVFAVGASVTILHYNGTQWSTIAFDPELGSPDFSCVWADSSSDIFVTSGSNVYHYGPSAAPDEDAGLAVWIIAVIAIAVVGVLVVAGYLLFRRRGASRARPA